MFDLYILYVKIQSDCFFIKKNKNVKSKKIKLFLKLKKTKKITVEFFNNEAQVHIDLI